MHLFSFCFLGFGISVLQQIYIDSVRHGFPRHASVTGSAGGQHLEPSTSETTSRPPSRRSTPGLRLDSSTDGNSAGELGTPPGLSPPGNLAACPEAPLFTGTAVELARLGRQVDRVIAGLRLLLQGASAAGGRQAEECTASWNGDEVISSLHQLSDTVIRCHAETQDTLIACVVDSVGYM